MPVTTGDELGELAASFNQMVEGLAERERIREAFGTYLDKEVAEYILSEGFTEEGVEVEVTVLFCDVRDFTEFASEATPQEVVAALNELFETIVPIIAATAATSTSSRATACSPSSARPSRSPTTPTARCAPRARSPARSTSAARPASCGSGSASTPAA